MYKAKHTWAEVNDLANEINEFITEQMKQPEHAIVKVYYSTICECPYLTLPMASEGSEGSWKHHYQVVNNVDMAYNMLQQEAAHLTHHRYHHHHHHHHHHHEDGGLNLNHYDESSNN